MSINSTQQTSLWNPVEGAKAVEESPAAPEVLPVKYYPINEEAARHAKNMNSFSDYTNH